MANKSPDSIIVHNLELLSHIGITDEERADPQRLTVSLEIVPRNEFHTLDEKLERTVDYFEVCEDLKVVAMLKPRILVETLAEEMAGHLLENYQIYSLTVELRKYILADTEYVAVRLTRPL